MDQLELAPESVVKSPLYAVKPDDAARLRGLRGEYMAAAQKPSVRQDINAEIGAYFVLAYK